MKTPRQVILEYVKRIREGGEPMAGLFYIVPTKDGGQDVAPEYQPDKDTDVQHSNFWEEKVVPNLLTPEFGLSAEDSEELKDAAYGVPRGRIVKPEWHQLQARKGKWMIYYGGEKEIQIKVQKKVMKYFNLEVLYQRGLVVWSSTDDDHERMQAYDRAIVKRILGL